MVTRKSAKSRHASTSKEDSLGGAAMNSSAVIVLCLAVLTYVLANLFLGE